MSISPKTDLTDNFGDEAREYRELYELGSNRSSSGIYNYTSTTSSTPYSSATGKDGMLAILAVVLVNNFLTAAEINSIMTLDATQTVTGQKLFSLLPQMVTYIAPTNDKDLTPKKYTDDEIVAAISALSFKLILETSPSISGIAAGDCCYKNSSGDWVGSQVKATGYYDGTNIILGGAIAIPALSGSTKYYIQSDWTISTTKTPFEVGQTGEPTELFVNFKPAQDIPIKEITSATYTLLITDAYSMIEANHAVGVVITLPPSLFENGTIIIVQQTGAGQVSFAAGAGVTIQSLNSADKIVGTDGFAFLIYNTTDVYSIGGAISA